MERDCVAGYLGQCIINFNSHAHVERDEFKPCGRMGKKNFNSHAHVERDLAWYLICIYRPHFNSHAHVERDKMAKTNKAEIIISTHTLTWSVTSYN